jgi:hypothetical protein
VLFNQHIIKQVLHLKIDVLFKDLYQLKKEKKKIKYLLEKLEKEILNWRMLLKIYYIE